MQTCLLRSSSQRLTVMRASQRGLGRGLLIVFGVLCSRCSVAQPSIEFTFVPPWGSFEDLEGRAVNINPQEFAVAPYIRVDQVWWTKPTFAMPTALIGSNGTWTVDITTGGLDHQATEIVAFLIPRGVTPPAADGAATLPDIGEAVASARATREPLSRTLDFAGRRWVVKSSDSPVGPGPNLFSERPEDVWTDAEGLHLSIREQEGQWWCTEVILEESLGYGTYVIQTRGRVDLFDANMILGLFTWDTQAPSEHFRELDFEYARWGDPDNPTNAHYVVQPCNACPGCDDRCHRYQVDLTDEESDLMHYMIWLPGGVTFRTYRGRDLAGC